MKKNLLVLIILVNNSIFGSNNRNISFVDPIIVEITDTTLENIYYHQNSFTEPTKLVFTNLTSVNGDVYFHNNVNLVEVDFPLLNITTGSCSFSGNTSLEIINAPNLTSIYHYLSISGNSSLQQLNICNLEEISIQTDEEILGDPLIPYYSISNNNSTTDANLPCFSQGAPENLAIDNLNIAENQNMNSVVGAFTADSNYTNGSLTFYLNEFELDNYNFSIVGNKLVTASTFDYETQNEFTIKLGVRNQLGEKLESEFTVTVQNVVNETINVIEITDTTLENINYDQNSFTEPTKLVFTNLTFVNGDVDFRNNANLVEVDFPLLNNTAGHCSFSGNASLEIINAPNLSSINDYLSIHGNSSLVQINICNLEEILIQVDEEVLGDPLKPYYSISNNNSTVDTNSPCFSQGAPENLTIDNLTIAENQNIDSIIGTLAADSNYTNGSLTFYLNESELDNDRFGILGDKLVTASPFDYESKNKFNIKIEVINQLGEKLESEFTINIQDVVNETIIVIEITDATLESIYYDKNSFTEPTKLVFTNLTSVNGPVYFHNIVNLVEIDFPLLENIESNFTVTGNPSLEIINAPNIDTVYDYLNVSENQTLEELNICSLSQILPSTEITLPPDPKKEPYYFVRNNPLLDFNTTCLIQTSVTFNPVTNIIVEPAPNTLVGTFSSDADSGSDISYFFVDDNGNEITSDDFVIIGNSVYLAREYEDYAQTDFALDINAIRVANIESTKNAKFLNYKFKNAANNINEKIDLAFLLNIENTSLSINDFTNEKELFLYPNPTKNTFYINSKNNIDVVSIYDLTGKHIKTFKSDENKYNVSHLTSGTYLIKIEQKDDKSIYTKRLIID